MNDENKSTSSASESWYCKISHGLLSGREIGPAPLDFFQSSIMVGTIPADAKFRKEGDSDWRDLGDILPTAQNKEDSAVEAESVPDSSDAEMQTHPEGTKLQPEVGKAHPKTTNSGLGWVITLAGGLFILVVMIVAGGIGRETARSVGQSFRESRNTSDFGAVLAESAAEWNRGLPMVIDGYTRLDRVGTNPKLMVIWYDYTLLRVTSLTIDRQRFRQATVNLRRTTTQDPDLRWLLDNGVRIEYRYYGYDGSYIDTVSIRPSDR